MATDFACEMVRQGFMLIAGGSDGIMGAVQRGAGRGHSFALGIRLPSEQRVNELIEGDPKLVTLNYFFTRKLSFVKEAHAFALLPGGFGTMDEAFEVLTLMQTGNARIVPSHAIGPATRKILGDVDAISYGAPVQVWLHFGGRLRVFQNQTQHAGRRRGDHAILQGLSSARWVGERFVIRLNRSLPNGALVDLNNHFRDILRRGKIVQRVALPKENDELETLDLPRLIFTPIRSRFGRFRQLIDAINFSPRM